ncbi:hypothetical protein AU05_14900 [Ectopseudomonas composti]|uniref:Uncharacterized protein n=1 Tax=Ectopseudomonas composti TaxID=658457 RepID=A0ABN0SBF2_9GAMM|nr:hypothetical protein [Pseudomonas composti]EZH79869.1 hypothetical protein AU05_14900 [Pseudomonas composti]
MQSLLSTFESAADNLMKVAGAAIKLSIALGSACVILYSIRIGHFPQGLALGDGLLFLLTAGCFGFLYVFFTAGLVGLGSCLSPLTNQVLKLSSWLISKFRGKKIDPAYELEPFQWPAIPFAVMAALMIFALGGRDYSVSLKLLAVAVMLHIFYSVAIDANRKLRVAQRLQDSVIETPEKAQTALEASKHKNTYNIVCFLIMLLPLLIGGVSGQLVDSAMRLANVRIEYPVIYTKAPYDQLLPESLIARNLKVPEGYKAYEGISVRFRGFGSTTVVAFKDEGIERQLEIPNDQLIVEKKTPKRVFPMSGDQPEAK